MVLIIGIILDGMGTCETVFTSTYGCDNLEIWFTCNGNGAGSDVTIDFGPCCRCNWLEENQLIPIVMGLPPFSEGVACALGPQWWTEDSTLWILIYLMMEFILDPVQQGVAQKNTVYKDSVQKDSTIYGDKH